MAATAPVRASYAALTAKLAELTLLSGVSGLLSWDQLTYMPPKAADVRSKQMEAIAGIAYDKSADPALGSLLEECAKDADALGERERANVLLARRNYLRLIRTPRSLATKMAELESRGYEVWAEARAGNSWAQFAPIVQEWVDLRREQARLVEPDMPVYDFLLDMYERGLTTERVRSVFQTLKAELIPMIKTITSSPAHASSRPLLTAPDGTKLKFDVELQKEINDALATRLGFDVARGRLDKSLHPFTGGPSHPTDVRMTTRYDPESLAESLTGTTHETGHALYEQGRRNDLQPISEAAGMAAHESQSLFFERMIGLRKEFWAGPAGDWDGIRKAFEAKGVEVEGWDADAFYRGINHVKPGFIRVEADEVTYPLHIVLRFEIELALMDGSLAVADVPAVWNAKMKEYLGVEVPTDTLGCLQDVHWSSGSFGYFPTYSFGAILCAQFFQRASAEIPGLLDKIAAGDLAPIRDWLRDRIWDWGGADGGIDALCRRVCGTEADADVFLGYLRQKYGDLYQAKL
ncbi:M32 carboxypeptidase Taq metallopeptidase peptidase [Hyaloraphidium curvatum]|nr:M32 carboxypeptidase Taq metallopeptidase peptidase [Hyaloraphidium curvatum]